MTAWSRVARLYVKTFLILKNLQGDFGHFKENTLSILSKVAKIALKIVLKLRGFSHKIGERRLPWQITGTLYEAGARSIAVNVCRVWSYRFEVFETFKILSRPKQVSNGHFWYK